MDCLEAVGMHFVRMPDDSLHQPHDKLFKAGFSDPVTAAAFLRDQLPPVVSGLIEWSNLKLQSGTFIDSQFRHTESDLLFSTTVSGKSCQLYLLFEHQSSPDPWLALRLLRYMVRIWEAHCQAHPGSSNLPAILPVVLVQNAEVWKIEPRLGALLDIPESISVALQPYVPEFAFRICQLAEMDFESIRGTAAGVLILRTMKAERLAQLLHESVWDESLLVQVPRDIFEMVLRYILDAEIDKTAFEHRILEISNPQTRANAMSLAQQYRQEGRQEGVWIGKIQVLQELIGEVVSDKSKLSSLSEIELEEQFKELQLRYTKMFKNPG